MIRTVSVHSAKTQLSSLLESVERGEEIIIARAGKPIARLTPLSPVRRPMGFVKDAALDESFFDPLPDDELDAWEGGNSTLP